MPESTFSSSAVIHEHWLAHCDGAEVSELPTGERIPKRPGWEDKISTIAGQSNGAGIIQHPPVVTALRPMRSIDTDVLSACFAGLPSAGQLRRPVARTGICRGE